MSFRPSSPVLRALSLCCLNSYFKFCCLFFTFGKVRSFSSQLSLNSSKISFQIAVRTLLEAPFSLSKRGAQAQSSFVSSTDQSAALVSVSVSVHVFPVLVLWTIPDPYMGCLEHSLRQVVLVEVVELRRNDLLETLAGSVADSHLLLNKTKIYGLGRL